MGLVATVRTQNKAEVITALADGGIEQQLDTLQGVRSIAVLDKLISGRRGAGFSQPVGGGAGHWQGTATAQEVRLLSGKAVVKGEVRVQCAWRARAGNRIAEPEHDSAVPAGAGCGRRPRTASVFAWWSR